MSEEGTCERDVKGRMVAGALLRRVTWTGVKVWAEVERVGRIGGEVGSSSMAGMVAVFVCLSDSGNWGVEVEWCWGVGICGISGLDAGWMRRVLRLIGRARVVVFCGVELRGVGPRRGAPISQAGSCAVPVGEHKASLETSCLPLGTEKHALVFPTCRPRLRYHFSVWLSSRVSRFLQCDGLGVATLHI